MKNWFPKKNAVNEDVEDHRVLHAACAVAKRKPAWKKIQVYKPERFIAIFQALLVTDIMH